MLQGYFNGMIEIANSNGRHALLWSAIGQCQWQTSSCWTTASSVAEMMCVNKMLIIQYLPVSHWRAIIWLATARCCNIYKMYLSSSCYALNSCEISVKLLSGKWHNTHQWLVNTGSVNVPGGTKPLPDGPWCVGLGTINTSDAWAGILRHIKQYHACWCHQQTGYWQYRIGNM